MRNCLTIILFLSFIPAVCSAQPLADRVPGDAQIYFGWSGTDSIGPGYGQSHLKAILDASQLPQFFQDSIPRIISRIQEEDPADAPRVQQAIDLLTPLAVHPWAFYLGKVDAIIPNMPPMPEVALICDASADAPKIAQQVSQLLHQQPGNPFDARAVDTLVVISDFAFPEKTDSPLSQNKDFQDAMGQVGKDPAMAFYVNGTALLTTINNAVQEYAPPQAQQTWPQIRDALGLQGLKTIAATAGLDGKNWSGQLIVNAPAPRKGLLALGDGVPVPPEIFKLIPESSTMAGAVTFDLNALFTTIDQALVQFAPDQANQFHQALAQVNQVLGFDIQKDFLAAIGPQWGYYVDPATAGNGTMGITLVNRPRNADRLQTSLTALENLANTMLEQQLQNQQTKFTVQFRQMTSNGTALHYLPAPVFAPSWAIKGGTLYMGLFPRIVDTALNRPADAKSIQDNPDFQATMQKLGAPQEISSFSYMDLAKTIPNGYQSFLMLGQIFSGVGDLFGADSPPLILPSLDKILAETEPSGAVSWTDDVGFHAKAIEPFPGATLMGAANGISAESVGQSAMMMSVLLPSLNRARETANRVKCASNLRQIGQGILLYSNDNRGAYPPDLGTLIKTEGIGVACFACPSSNTSVPPNMTPDQAADWVNANSDYIYIGAGLRMGADPTTVVCYEKDGDHAGDGMNILFADGHVEFQQMDAAHQLISNSTKPH